MQQRVIPLSIPLDLEATLFGVRRGKHDPTCTVNSHELWRATRTPEGPATVHVVLDGDRAEARAWGDGAEWALEALPGVLGQEDDDHGFSPSHPVVARLWRDLAGVRVPRTCAVAETLVNVVLEQRVTTYEARRAQTQIVQRWSEPAPGPTALLLPADPEVLANLAYYDLHLVGVEQKRADTVRRVAAGARGLDALVHAAHHEAHARLLAIPGVGPWSAAEVALVALGDADAVPVGDIHLPTDVTYVLTGEAVDDDEAMLDALAPFAGQRGRVIRLILAAGLHAPRRAPRYAPRDYRDA